MNVQIGVFTVEPKNNGAGILHFHGTLIQCFIKRFNLSFSSFISVVPPAAVTCRTSVTAQSLFIDKSIVNPGFRS